MVTRSKRFGSNAGVANTKTELTGSPYTLPSGTRKIVGLAVGVEGETITEGLSGFIILEIDTVNGPFEYVITGNSNYAVATGAAHLGMDKKVDIPVPGAGVLHVYHQMTDTVDVVNVSVEFE